MHIPDGLVSGPINITAGVLAAGAVGISAWKVSRESEVKPMLVPLLATTAAFVFAAQMLNFPIGGGTSGHFLGAIAVAALLGPAGACLVMTLVLAIQCLGFADGGLTALGTNIFNMGIVGGFGSYFLLRLLRSVLPEGRAGYLAAVGVVSWFSVVGASFCAFELSLSGTAPLKVVLPAMVGTHVIIGIGEALIAVAVLSAVAVSRPDILPRWAQVDSENVKPTIGRKKWKFAFAGVMVALALAMFASPFASGFPDGLEKTAEDKGFIESVSENPLWSGSPLPDYAVPGISSEGVSTGAAGFIGTAGIFIVGVVVIKLVGKRRCSNSRS